MKSLKKQMGFTLIELMIVIAIIGILMVYAIPAYNSYTIRAKAGECLSLSNGAKTGVSERWSYLNSLTQISSNTTAYVADTITGNNVASVLVGANAVITCTFNAKDGKLNSESLTLTPTVVAGGGSLTWACSTSIVRPEHRPGGCTGP